MKVAETEATHPTAAPSDMGAAPPPEETTTKSTAPSRRQWTSVHDQYRTIEILGQGTYGVVYKAEHKTTGEIVAMKRCRLDAFRDFGIPETTLREIALLRDLRHENIMKLHRVSCNTERIYMICEFLDLDLKKYLRANPNGIPLRKVKEITYEILKGLAFCHGHRVLHRDLKPHNVLVSSDATKVKIADFGLARSSLVPGKTLTHEVITLWYRAPELLLGHCNYSTGVDIWSAGCIVAELLSTRPLYVGDSEIDTLFKIFRLLGTPKREQWPERAVVPWSEFPTFRGVPDPFGQLSPELDDAGRDFLTRIFQFNPTQRPSAIEALNHAWLAEVRDGYPKESCLVPEWREWGSQGKGGWTDASTVPSVLSVDTDSEHCESSDDQENDDSENICRSVYSANPQNTSATDGSTTAVRPTETRRPDEQQHYTHKENGPPQSKETTTAVPNADHDGDIEMAEAMPGDPVHAGGGGGGEGRQSTMTRMHQRIITNNIEEQDEFAGQLQISTIPTTNVPAAAAPAAALAHRKDIALRMRQLESQLHQAEVQQAQIVHHRPIDMKTTVRALPTETTGNHRLGKGSKDVQPRTVALNELKVSHHVQELREFRRSGRGEPENVCNEGVWTRSTRPGHLLSRTSSEHQHVAGKKGKVPFGKTGQAPRLGVEPQPKPSTTHVIPGGNPIVRGFTKDAEWLGRLKRCSFGTLIERRLRRDGKPSAVSHRRCGAETDRSHIDHGALDRGPSRSERCLQLQASRQHSQDVLQQQPRQDPQRHPPPHMSHIREENNDRHSGGDDVATCDRVYNDKDHHESTRRPTPPYVSFYGSNSEGALRSKSTAPSAASTCSAYYCPRSTTFAGPSASSFYSQYGDDSTVGGSGGGMIQSHLRHQPATTSIDKRQKDTFAFQRRSKAEWHGRRRSSAPTATSQFWEESSQYNQKGLKTRWLLSSQRDTMFVAPRGHAKQQQHHPAAAAAASSVTITASQHQQPHRPYQRQLGDRQSEHELLFMPPPEQQHHGLKRHQRHDSNGSRTRSLRAEDSGADSSSTTSYKSTHYGQNHHHRHREWWRRDSQGGTTTESHHHRYEPRTTSLGGDDPSNPYRTTLGGDNALGRRRRSSSSHKITSGSRHRSPLLGNSEAELSFNSETQPPEFATGELRQPPAFQRALLHQGRMFDASTRWNRSLSSGTMAPLETTTRHCMKTSEHISLFHGHPSQATTRPGSGVCQNSAGLSSLQCKGHVLQSFHRAHHRLVGGNTEEDAFDPHTGHWSLSSSTCADMIDPLALCGTSIPASWCRSPQRTKQKEHPPPPQQNFTSSLFATEDVVMRSRPARRTRLSVPLYVDPLDNDDDDDHPCRDSAGGVDGSRSAVMDSGVWPGYNTRHRDGNMSLYRSSSVV